MITNIDDIVDQVRAGEDHAALDTVREATLFGQGYELASLLRPMVADGSALAALCLSVLQLEQGELDEARQTRNRHDGDQQCRGYGGTSDLYKSLRVRVPHCDYRGHNLENERLARGNRIDVR